MKNPNQLWHVYQFYIHYYSKREGLKDFVRGLLQGLGKLYNTTIQIDLLEDRDKGDHHEIFKVSW